MKRDGIAHHLETVFVVRAGQEGDFGKLSDLTIPKLYRAAMHIIDSSPSSMLQSSKTLLLSGVDRISVATAGLLNDSLQIPNRVTSSVLDTQHDKILRVDEHRTYLKEILEEYLNLIVVVSGELAPYFHSLVYYNDLSTTGSLDPVHGTVHRFQSGRYEGTFIPQIRH